MGKLWKGISQESKIEWKEKYFNYKELKQMIKQFIKEENEKEPQLQQSINDQNSSIEVAREKRKESRKCP